jgi:hypothetical protein
MRLLDVSSLEAEEEKFGTNLDHAILLSSAQVRSLKSQTCKPTSTLQMSAFPTFVGLIENQCEVLRGVCWRKKV